MSDVRRECTPRSQPPRSSSVRRRERSPRPATTNARGHRHHHAAWTACCACTSRAGQPQPRGAARMLERAAARSWRSPASSPRWRRGGRALTPRPGAIIACAQPRRAQVPRTAYASTRWRPDPRQRRCSRPVLPVAGVRRTWRALPAGALGSPEEWRLRRLPRRRGDVLVGEDPQPKRRGGDLTWPAARLNRPRRARDRRRVKKAWARRTPPPPTGATVVVNDRVGLPGLEPSRGLGRTALAADMPTRGRPARSSTSAEPARPARRRRRQPRLHDDGAPPRPRPDDWWRVVDTNLSGTFHLVARRCRSCARARRPRGRHRERWGVTGCPRRRRTPPPKAGSISLVKRSARVLAPEGIIVKPASHGVTDTPQLQVDATPPGVAGGDPRRYAAGIPVGRIGRPERSRPRCRCCATSGCPR